MIRKIATVLGLVVSAAAFSQGNNGNSVKSSESSDKQKQVNGKDHGKIEIIDLERIEETTQTASLSWTIVDQK